MKCAICGMEVKTIDQAIENNWLPYFYDGGVEHGPACSSCAEMMIELGDIKSAFQIFQKENEEMLFSERSFIILGEIYLMTDDTNIIDSINKMAGQYEDQLRYSQV